MNLNCCSLKVILLILICSSFQTLHALEIQQFVEGKEHAKIIKKASGLKISDDGVVYITSESKGSLLRVVEGKVELISLSPELFKSSKLGGIDILRNGNLVIVNRGSGQVGIANAKLKPVNEPQIELVKFAPSMKNYRFDLIKADTQLIDLFGLSGVLNEEWIDDRVIHWAHDYDDQFIGRDDTLEIKYLSVDYTRQDTRLSVQFSTPLPGRPDKLVRINVFMKGVVKILGSLHDSVTVSVIRYLHKIIFDHPELLIDEEVDETNANNIICDEVNQALFEEMLKLQYPLIFNKIEITEEDELNFQNWLDKYIITP